MFTDLSPNQYSRPRYRYLDRGLIASAATENALKSSSGDKNSDHVKSPKRFAVSSRVNGKGIQKLINDSVNTEIDMGDDGGVTSKNDVSWKSFRLSGYLVIIEALLQRGSSEVTMDSALLLLKEMILKENLYLHQSQIRSLLYTAILHDQCAPSEVSSTYGNGVRVFLTLRQLKCGKPDDVLYRMIIKSVIKRKKSQGRTAVGPSKLDSQKSKEPSEIQFELSSKGESVDGDMSSVEALLSAMAEDGTKPSTLTNREVYLYIFIYRYIFMYIKI